ncbi:hypothetical protein C922_00003 [Plasmodium inui San Antonio 1]|uniref:Uncharacterized protein n=1 Tax=Plasmodium inui San Antonio 1 TaxID=1237626 RepID=W7ABS2_9APIC|nr:hypothetical protein C922_00003 [Plasmodium inui San Antonio 1]EUD69140.1 hypothetical protein C922_00003 [Plasmodium inui San Antonio 1]
MRKPDIINVRSYKGRLREGRMKPWAEPSSMSLKQLSAEKNSEKVQKGEEKSRTSTDATVRSKGGSAGEDEGRK